jgi:hypothetical protein
MNATEQEKVELEHQAARVFMRAWERQHSVPLRHIWHNRPTKPDVSCQLDGQRLDLEIAHLYGSEVEAMAILGRHLSPATHQALLELMQDDVHQRLLHALNRILAVKAQKRYKTERVWLVIRNANPLWKNDDMLALRQHFTVPQRHPFEQIWMVTNLSNNSDILQLYPD